MISIVTSGSRGDVQPYVALGKALKDEGCPVRILASENFEKLVTDAGLLFASTGASMEEALASEAWRKTLESGNFIKILRKMNQEMKLHADAYASVLPDALEGSELVIAGMSTMAVFPIVQKNKIPLIQAYVFPFSPTSAYSAPLFASLPFGNILNRLSFHLVRQIFWHNTKLMNRKISDNIGVSSSGFFGPFRALNEQGVPALYGYSRYVLPQADDLPDNHYVTGYWFLDPSENWSPPVDLLDFLESGTPPVYIGFGSMGSRNPQEAGQIALEALERSGQRGVLAAGWGGLTPSDVPDTVYLLESIPHSWLFPRMSAVVHHGGAGTTAAGLRAGVPSIIVPFMADQPYWGHHVHRLGVGTKPIPRKKLTAEKLAQAINEAVTNEVMRHKAQQLGKQINAENGNHQAAQYIKKWMGMHPSTDL